MYRKTERSFQYHPGIEQEISDVIGGGTISRADMVGVAFNGVALDELPPLVVVGKDSDGLWHVIKTAKIVEGGSDSAPRVAKNHLFKVGDVLSGGKVALELNSVDKTESEYDTFGFDDGALLEYTAGTVLYQVETVDTLGGVAASAVVTDDVEDTLTVSIPVGSLPENFNGLVVKIKQAADDNLAVDFEDGVLTISLADTTAANNNAALIQAAIRALGLVAPGLDFSLATAVGSAGWDGNQTGGVLTDDTAVFANGVNYGEKPYQYSQLAITKTKVNLTVANQTAGLLEAGKVNETVMPFPIDARLKAALRDIRFV